MSTMTEVKAKSIGHGLSEALKRLREAPQEFFSETEKAKMRAVELKNGGYFFVGNKEGVIQDKGH